MGRREHRRAVGTLALERHLHGAELVAEIGAGEDRERAGRLQGRFGVDARDLCVGVHRAHDDRVRLPGKIDVVVKATLALDEADVLEPLDRLPDPELPHYGTRTILP